MKQKIYTMYKVQGYDRYERKEDLFMNATNITVIADTENDALDKAAKLLKKPNYRIIEVYQIVV